MGKFDNIIIVTDLDGTFFNDDSKPPENNVAAVKYFTQNGGHFSFSTGRNESILRKIIPDTISLNNMPAILSNGAYMYDFAGDTRTEEVVLPADDIKELVSKIEERFPECGIRWNCEEGFVTYNLEKLSKYDLPVYRNALPEYTKEYIFSQKLYKAVVAAPSEIIPSIRDFIASESGERFSYSITTPCSVEIMHCDATKGKALKKLKALLGIPDATVYAMGDYENDYDMLLSADVAVCPSNALDSIKKISDMVLCSNNEGLFENLLKVIEEELTK